MTTIVGVKLKQLNGSVCIWPSKDIELLTATHKLRIHTYIYNAGISLSSGNWKFTILLYGLLHCSMMDVVVLFCNDHHKSIDRWVKYLNTLCQNLAEIHDRWIPAPRAGLDHFVNPPIPDRVITNHKRE